MKQNDPDCEDKKVEGNRFHWNKNQIMNLTIIADTHGIHDEIILKPGTMLIHAGDITEYGTEEEFTDFLMWFSKQPFKYKIFIAGNHDLFLEECTATKRKRLIPKDIIYLQNSGVEIEGLKIWGSPVSPYFLGMAFNVRSGNDIRKIWKKIPHDTDILITHGPPKGMLDDNFGCEELAHALTIINPKIHCFGHVHGCNGRKKLNKTLFINAALVNRLQPMEQQYFIADKPVLLDLTKLEIKKIMKQEQIKPNNYGQTLLDLIVQGGDNLINEYHKKYHLLPYIDKLDGYVNMINITIKKVTEGLIDSETDRKKILTGLKLITQKMLDFKEKIILENQIQKT